MDSKREAKTRFEEMGYEKGYQCIAGVDEAGRGPLAGPVVAAACIFPRGLFIEDIDDSKKLSSEKREELYHYLVAHPQIDFAVGIVENPRIDEINILQASLEAMTIAVSQLSLDPDYLLIDGIQIPKTGILSKAIVQGDCHSQSIGAASIIAKHTRDVIMVKYHAEWPHYGFDQHKGYGTKKHLETLAKHGPCPIHRRSFEPVKSHSSS